jgi:hypothetical protein
VGVPAFEKRVIGELRNDVGDAAMNTLCIVGDVNADGRPDVVVSGRNGRMAWFENPGRPGTGPWTMHPIDRVRDLECGGLVRDLDGDGWGDIIDGGDYRSDELSWWRNPGPAGGPWSRHVIARTGSRQFHDELVADVAGDGRPSLVFWNQGAGALHHVPLPPDPTVTPWPGIARIASGRREDGQAEEGLAAADLDGDGAIEIVAGTHWYRREPGGWEGHRFARGYITTKVAVGDLDGDGLLEIVLSEGDACIYGRPQGGRLAWFQRGADMRAPWVEHEVEAGLLDPHTLQVADLCGHGRLDLLVGEIGLAGGSPGRTPRLLIYENDGRGGFVPHVVDEGSGTHNAVLVDLYGRGAPDIVGRPLHGPEKWQIHVFERTPGFTAAG